MNILIIAPSPPQPHSLEMFYKNAFVALGHTVHVSSIRDKLSMYGRLKRRLSRLSYRGLGPEIGSEHILQKLGDFKPQLSIVFRGEDLKPCAVEALQHCSNLGCINIYPDSPFVIPGIGAAKIMPTLEKYTLTYTFSRALIPVFEQLGATNVKWLPFGYDSSLHTPSHENYPGHLARIGYLGVWGPLQEAWLDPLCPFGLNIYGHGWKQAHKGSAVSNSWRSGQGIGKNMNQAVNSVDIVFNLVRAEHGCAHSMKTFEIPACGGFMLTNWTAEQAEFFEDGRDCVFFHTQEEMVDKVRFYLENESSRKKIKMAGQKAVEPFNYISRAQSILSDIAK